MAGKFKIVLCSDERAFGGHDRIKMDGEYFTNPEPWNDRKNSLRVYVPCRVALVLGLAE
ncbi:glycoside hydrolase family 13 protein [Atractiella rhizophila]|nr:glycoside hydrolase family 13 protein [Atractiella rhizophila]